MSANEDYKGYRGKALDALTKYEAKVWSDVEISTHDGDEYIGLILPPIDHHC